MRGSGVFRALRYPDFFWYWSSYFVSNVGAWMQNVAQGWLLYELTDSPLILPLQPVAHGDAVLLLSPRRARRRPPGRPAGPAPPAGPAAGHDVDSDRLAYHGLSPGDPRVAPYDSCVAHLHSRRDHHDGVGLRAAGAPVADTQARQPRRPGERARAQLDHMAGRGTPGSQSRRPARQPRRHRRLLLHQRCELLRDYLGTVSHEHPAAGRDRASRHDAELLRRTAVHSPPEAHPHAVDRIGVREYFRPLVHHPAARFREGGPACRRIGARLHLRGARP